MKFYLFLQTKPTRNHNPLNAMTVLEQVYNDFKMGKVDMLYAELYPSMLTYAARYLMSDYAMMAEDCVQNAILKAYDKRTSFVSPFQLKSFLFTCIHNDCISILRRVKTKNNYLNQTKEETEQEFSASMIEQETLDLLYRAIEELPEKYRELFELNYQQGLKNTEAAKQLGITIDGFNKRKAKMISLLRERFIDNDAMQLLITMLLV